MAYRKINVRAKSYDEAKKSASTYKKLGTANYGAEALHNVSLKNSTPVGGHKLYTLTFRRKKI